MIDEFKVGDKVYDTNPVCYGDKGIVTKVYKDRYGVIWDYQILWQIGEGAGQKLIMNRDYFHWLKHSDKYENFESVKDFLELDE